MTDIKLDIEVKGVRQIREAANELLRTGNVSRKLAAEFSGTSAANMRLVKETRRLERVKRELSKAVKDNIISSNKATRVLNEEIRKSKERVLTDKTVIAQQKKAAKATEEYKKETERLVKLYAPAKAAKNQFKQSVKEIDQALSRGAISAEEHSEAMRVLNFEFNQFTKGVATGGNQFAKFNVEAYKSAQTIKRQFNTGMQQAGYQVGDFFVQIQSGQSALVALGQQGSQLAGIFGPGGALVGAFLAIGTAIATIVVQAKKAEEALHSMKIGFQDATRGATEAIKQLRIENYQLKNDVDNVTEAMLLLATAEQEASKKANELKNETNLLGRTGIFEFGGGFTVAGFEIVKTDEEKLELLERQREVLKEQLKENKRLIRLKQAEIRDIEQRFKAEAELFDMSVEMSEEVLELIAKRVEKERRSIDERFKGEAAVFAQSVEISQELIRLIEKRAEKERRAIEQRFKGEAAVFAQAVKISGELLEAAEKLAERERRSVDERFEGEAALFKQKVEISRELIKAAEALIEKEQRSIDQRFKGEAALFAQAVAISSETQALIDKRLESEKRAIDQRFKGEAEVFNQAVKVSDDLLKVIEEKAEEAAKLVKAKFEAEDFLFRVRFASETEVMNQPVSPAPDAGQGARDAQQEARDEAERQQKRIRDYINSLQNQRDKEKQLVGIFDEQRDLMGSLIDARQEYGDIATDSQMKIIEGYIQETHALEQQQKALEKARAQQEQLKETIESSMEDAFMSIVDGTKTVEDAFREMARQIIAELMRVLVVKQMVSAATGFFGFADGGAFQGGSQIQAYAKGGIVGGPTYFPMAGGKTGLMGEAGPEAIMPLKRGKNGKLGVESSGQGNNIVINQSFNFAANGDDSVKRIIASEAPKIAKMTEAQILDNSRRGGQFRKAFA